MKKAMWLVLATAGIAGAVYFTVWVMAAAAELVADDD
jgi:hypothetical protein